MFAVCVDGVMVIVEPRVAAYIDKGVQFSGLFFFIVVQIHIGIIAVQFQIKFFEHLSQLCYDCFPIFQCSHLFALLFVLSIIVFPSANKKAI